jgi:eukaryotic-like serine/threonine-protein kinase
MRIVRARWKSAARHWAAFMGALLVFAVGLPYPVNNLIGQQVPRPLIPRERTPDAEPGPSQIKAPSEDEGGEPVAAPRPALRRQSNESGHNWLLIGAGVVGAGLVIGLLIVVVRAQPQKRAGKKVTFRENQVDNYRLVNLIQTGQNSQVWEAAEMASGRHFAIKILLPEHAHSPAQRGFLFHEAEVARKLVHSKIIKFLEVVKDPDHPYAVMEFFPSTNLKLRLARKDPFVREHIREIIEQTATALAFMHSKGWVHRDVKPDHILVNASADIRLIDFALAQRIMVRKKGVLGRQKKAGKAMGTRSYMSPEQIRGEALDARADLYSFGATIYDILAGRPPFRAATPEDLLTKHILEAPASPELYNPDVHRDTAELVLSMLAKDPGARPRDMQDFLMRFRKARVFKAVAHKKSS